MKDLEEQRFCVKFSFKLGKKKTFTETFQTLQQARIFPSLSVVTFVRFRQPTSKDSSVSIVLKNEYSLAVVPLKFSVESGTSWA